MVVESGTIPYAYSAQTPLRAPNVFLGGAMGPSGILIEQGQFVALAEYRRFAGHLGFFETEFFKYVNQEIARIRYEPSASGNNLASGLAAGLHYINSISETRTALESAWGQIASDCDYTSAELKQDWLRQAFGTDSGVLLGEWWHSDDLSAGRIPFSEVFLGGSGMLYDVDFGEIMYNPYPRFAELRYSDTRVPGGGAGNIGSFNVVTAPIFPAFQTTLGNLISLNSFDLGFKSGYNNDNYDLRFLNASGVIRIDGDVLASGTVYFLGTGNKFDDSGTVIWTFADGSTRGVGGDFAPPQTRVFVSPNSHASGAFQAIAVNRRTAFPNTAIESGIISTWPPISTAFPNYSIIPGGDNDAYEVMNDCFWMVDIPGPGSAFFDQQKFPPSGLAVISPFTGRALWVRRADNTVTSHPSAGDVVAWPDLCGLTRTGTNSILRVAKDISGSTGSTTIYFMEYDDDLNFVAEHTTTFAGPTATFEEISDLWYDGSSLFCMERATGAVNEFNASTYAFIERFFSGFTTPGHRGAYFNSKQWQYRPSVSGIWEVAYAGGLVSNVAFRSILMPPNLVVAGGDPDDVNIEDIIEVAGATHTPNGIWALIEYKRGASEFLYLVKLREEASSFEVESVTPVIFDTYNKRSERGDANRFYDFLWMPIT